MSVVDSARILAQSWSQPQFQRRSRVMTRSEDHVALTDEVARFQAQVRRLAFDVIRVVLGQELDRRKAALAAARPGKRRPTRQFQSSRVRQRDRKPVQQPKRKPARRSRQEPEQQPAPDVAPPPEIRSAEAPDPSGTVPAPAPATPDRPAVPTPGTRTGAPWTRETVIHELATWLASGTVIDAAFMSRHGPKGLVSSTRRLFGRFEAALNVAALHVSKLYPDGPPRT